MAQPKRLFFRDNAFLYVNGLCFIIIPTQNQNTQYKSFLFSLLDLTNKAIETTGQTHILKTSFHILILSFLCSFVDLSK